MGKVNKNNIWQPKIIKKAFCDSLIKLDPRAMIQNPVMFIVELVSVITTVITIQNILNGEAFLFDLQISFWLWFTVLFANFAEALAEGKGKAQAESLKSAKKDVVANKLLTNGEIKQIDAIDLKKDNLVIVSDNMIIPSDGEIIEGVALVDGFFRKICG